ncbi:MAG: DEAD/DEAH box helicase, partial [Fidelibacterota bacterium]
MKLDSPVTELSRIGKILANRLKKLEIETIKDLIFYFPWRYDDFSEVIPLGQVEGGMSGSFRGKIELIAGKRSPRKKMHITEALVADDTGSIKVVWFNQPFLTKILKQGQEVTLSGKAEQDYYGLVLQSPSYELSSSGDTTHTARIIPIYSLTSSLTQKQLRTLIKSSLSFIDEVDEWLPDSVKQDLQLMDIAEALHEVHFPSNQEKLNKAQKRLKFEELFLVQLQAQWLKQDNQKSKSPAIEFREKETKQFVGDLPFDLTDDQKKAAWQILQDLAKDHPMNRLLEGDVGSGKTIVSAIALYNAALNNVQAVYMAPTEILAKQQFETLSKLLSGYVVGLLSRSERLISNNGKVNSVSKAKFLKELEAGKIQVSIGTHALIQKDINFNNLGFVVVDEQHRFGVEQRAAHVSR